MNQKETRPDLFDVSSGEQLKRWYWLKAELVDYCKAVKLNYTGSKAAITDRIATWLDTGKEQKPQRRKVKSKFNWARETLHPDTIITDSYRNGPNVRRFMLREVGPHFKFNIAFMDWMKANVGKTLADAVQAWIAIYERQKDKSHQTKIPASNQYNQYMRDFFADNPGATIQDARKYWKLKRSLPGHNKYEKSDLSLPKS
ncbi:MAG: DUF6434 domain-containing protein [Bacteroidota bacterium]